MYQFDKKQKKVIEWLALPRDLRVQKSQAELAEVLGVTDQTISNWKKLPGFAQAVNREAARWAQNQYPRLLARVYERSFHDNNPKWAELVLKYILPHLEQAGLLDEQDQGQNVNEEMIMARIATLPHEKREAAWELVQFLFSPPDQGATIDQEAGEITAITPYGEIEVSRDEEDTDEQE